MQPLVRITNDVRLVRMCRNEDIKFTWVILYVIGDMRHQNARTVGGTESEGRFGEFSQNAKPGVDAEPVSFIIAKTCQHLAFQSAKWREDDGRNEIARKYNEFASFVVKNLDGFPHMIEMIVSIGKNSNPHARLHLLANVVAGSDSNQRYYAPFTGFCTIDCQRPDSTLKEAEDFSQPNQSD